MRFNLKIEDLNNPKMRILEGPQSSDEAVALAREQTKAGRKVSYVRFVDETLSTCGYTFTSAEIAAEPFPIVSFTEESCYADPEVQRALEAYAAYDYVKDNYNQADLFILDGLISAVERSYIKQEEVEALLHERPAAIDIVLTGM